MPSAEVILSRQQDLAADLRLAMLRLDDPADALALHDLRVGLRRLRSLLDLLPDADDGALQWAATAAGRLLGPARDLEVLNAELLSQNQPAAAARRQRRLRVMRRIIRDSQTLQFLLAALTAWPTHFVQASQGDSLWRLPAHVAKRQQKQVKTLRKALADRGHDRHDLRLLIKQVRYGARSCPELSVLAPEALKALKQVQTALGEWHDREQWLAVAEEEGDLTPLCEGWRTTGAVALKRAEKGLKGLAKRLA